MLKNDLFFYLILFLFLSNFILIESDDDSDIQDLKNHNSGISLADLEMEGIFDNKGDYYYQITYVDNQIVTKNGINYPKVEISEKCIQKLRSAETEKSIVIAKIFRIIEYSDPQINYLAGIQKLTDIVYYQFFYLAADETSLNDEINIATQCGEKVIYHLPIYSDEALKNKFVSVSGQNPESGRDKLREYDIFDPNSEIYDDICKTITYSVASENVDSQDSFDNYDITLKERRNYYYPGDTELCPKDFSYIGIDKNTFSAMCEINHQIFINPPGYEIHDEFNGFKAGKNFKKDKSNIYFSMQVLKCIALPFTPEGFKNNYGNFIILVLIFIVLACYLILLLTGKYHLLSVLELLYNSNIKSMNYLKGSNPNAMYNPQTNLSNNQIIPYDIKSNNNLGTSHQTALSNGQLLQNFLSGNSYLYQPNGDKLTTNKKGNKTSSLQNNNKNNENDIKKKDLMSNVDEQENDYESEKDNEDKDKTNIINSSREVDIIKKNKEAKTNEKKSEREEEKENENEEEEDNEEDGEESVEESESNRSYKNKIKKNNNRAHPPKKKNGNEDNDEENGKKKKKTKNPIEISLNVKDLRDMMFKDQIPMSENKKLDDKSKNDKESKKKNKNKSKDNINNNMPPNGFPYSPYMPPMGMMPYGMPPPYAYPMNGGDPKNEETQKLKRELEYQKELNERREREMRREREEMLEKERERQRQRDLDYEREKRLREMELRYVNNNGSDPFNNRMEKIGKGKGGIKRGSALWNEDSDDILVKEREKFYAEQDKFNRVKERLEEELRKKSEENAKLQNELNLAKEELRSKLTGYENDLLKKNQELREQFEKEKKEIIEAKDREIQRIKEDKDREIQILKEDKEREIKLLKEDMSKEIKKKDVKLKKKDKVIEQQKKESNDLKKDLTTNTFYTNNMNMATALKQQMMESNYRKEDERFESPQVVVPITSIFTDQELNALDFEDSCQYDKRSLCQVYLSFINRKQPLFFLFNYNSSSSGISVFQINFQSLRFIIICIDFMVYMFIYATFFGSKSISQIYFGIYNFRRMCILGSIISPFCLIIRSVIHHFIYDPMNKKIAEIKMKCYTNFIIGKKKDELKVNEFKEFWESEGEGGKNKDNLDKKEEIADIQEIENDDNLTEEEKMRRKDKYEKRRLKLLIKQVIAIFQKKLLISFGIIIIAMFFEWMYISSFCAVYKNSQLQFFLSILVCYGFANLMPVVYCLVPTILKQDAVRDESRFSYILANIFQII